MLRKILLGAAGVLAGLSCASAHISLENQQAPVGASYKAVMRVPHGCDGTATTSLRIRMPEGFISVKPMPKPGWKLDTVTGKYPKPYTLGRAKVSEGVTEVSWSSGKLPDAFYDEFVFTGAIAEELKVGQTVYFPVVQECEKGVLRWIDIPAAGAPEGHGEGDSTPAPGLRLLPKR